ncbi:MAG: hypothetical protein A3I78_02745 [Gammaproteobacteria bacterium RIFCSPLOWO2_02_FULL_56_15]|nr:MAG: hypothetical protein A3I78_02745 [Gammaproteobacteria bacterium RIFCSPLOWO2_02_FULL_56_15]
MVATALCLAATLLLLVILPAEYSIDPTGIGARLDILGISGIVPTDVIPVAARQPVSPVSATVLDPDEPSPLADPAVHQPNQTPYRSELIEIHMAADEQLEFKIVMDRDQVILYSWELDRGDLYYDMHAEPRDGPPGYWVRYEEGDGKAAAHGSLKAPFSGHHGWYFLNYNEFPVTIRLQLSGNYREVVELGRSSVFQ